MSNDNSNQPSNMVDEDDEEINNEINNSIDNSLAVANNNENRLEAEDVVVEVDDDVDIEDEDVEEVDEVDEFDHDDDDDDVDDEDVDYDYIRYLEAIDEQNDPNMIDDDDDDNDFDDEAMAFFQLGVRNDVDDYDDVQRPSQINFDTNLPAAHNYLGENFEDVNKPKILHEQDDILTIPILQLPSSVQLLPGQVMPYAIHQPVQINLIKNLIDEHGSGAEPTVGFLLHVSGTDLQVGTTIGILGEILSSKNEDNDPNSSLVGLMLKIRGRDRFRLVKIKREVTSGCFIADVKVCPEYVLGKNPLRQRAHLNTTHLLDSYFKRHAAPVKSLAAKVESLNTTPHPAWLFRQYDCSFITRLILDELRQSYDETQLPAKETIPIENPSLFSHWILNNIPFDDHLRLRILQIDCVNQRLSFIHSVLVNYSSLNCRICRTEICKKSDIFSMSTQGFMSAYVNPNGHIHETLTVFKAKNLTLFGFPSSQFSWFPGYQWTIVNCRQCQTHMGWKFTAEAKNKNLKPQKFWGLTRHNLTTMNYTVPPAQTANEIPTVANAAEANVVL